ncbi:rhoGEF domain-containing protein [Sarocladium implicatum]|nr:rhoGEF domain-containing protein [Sarocladium implicatum]
MDHDGARGEPRFRGFDYLDDAHHHSHYQQPNLVASPSQLHPDQPDAFTETSGLDRPASDDAHHAYAPVNPDDFYKSFRALHFDSTPESLPMASSSVPRPSLRSNSNGMTPRHPVMPADRGPSRFNATRSVSSPADPKASAVALRPSPTGRPSVRDMANRFDQVNATPTSSIPRAAGSTRPKRDSATDSRSRNGAQPYASLRGGSAQDDAYGASTTSPRSNRIRAGAEDHVSNNPQSFASRVGKPRTSISGNPNASKSMTHLAQKSPTKPSPAPPVPSSQPLLFGEILPEQRDAAAPGFGIDGIQLRRTSDSDLRASGHQRSFSNPDIEPSSPSTWYRSLNELQDQASDNTSPRTHARSQSHSESPTFITPSSSSDLRANERSTPKAPVTPASVGSRLPVSVRNAHSPSSSSPSTRSNSPATLKRPKANGRAPISAPASASKTKVPISRAKTPTQTPGGRRLPAPSPVTPGSSNNTRLNAYIANPPPKLSPTLRSSRPRQPVSEATTASSRMRAADRAKSPGAAYVKAAAGAAEPTQRRRKISLGPIDFAQRREHIKLAYSKSVRESKAIEAREQAAERRRKDMEAAARAKARSEAVALASALPPEALAEDLGVLSASEAEPTPIHEKPHNEVLTSQAGATPDSANVHHEGTNGSVEDSGNSALSNIKTQPAEQSLVKESPTLGVPGSFPMLSPPIPQEPRPESAGSANTITTEFDNEPQIAPPVQVESPVGAHIAVIRPPSPPKPSPSPRAEYQYPFRDEPDTAEDALPTTDSASNDEARITHNRDSSELAVPGAFGDDLDGPVGSGSPYEAEVMIMPPSNGATSQSINNHTVPFPRIDSYEESDCQTDVEDPRALARHSIYDADGATTDACTEDSELDEKTTDCGADSRLADSVCDSSDAESPDPREADVTEHSRSGLRTLQVPSARGYADRTSQQSSWTDLSIESNGYSDSSRSPAMQNDESPVYGHATIFEASPKPTYETPSFSHNPYSSPNIRPTYDSARSSAVLSQSELPALDTGERFAISYMAQPMSREPTQESTTSAPYYVPRPNHEPPPIPPSGQASTAGSRRTSGMAFEPPLPGSAMSTSTRPSIDYVNLLETPQTADSMSLENSDAYFPSQAPSAESSVPQLSSDSTTSPEKEHRRLVQRHNVIKELIDTEMVFVRDMNIVEEIYKGTAEACPNLDDNTVKLVFRNTTEIIEFHTGFLANLKAAVSGVYVPKGGRSAASASVPGLSEVDGNREIDDEKDRGTAIGPAFQANIEAMKVAHEGFLRNSDHAAKRLIQIQQDPAVKLWLNECNEVAKDLTAAWDLDSLLIKPMQRITKYPNIIITLLQHTPKDHPDREPLIQAKDTLETAIIDINKTKKNFELVGQIVGRKRKESDVKAGFARAFGKRVDKLQATGRPTEDTVYAKLNEKFGDDYLRLQVVLRDVEFYTRQVSAYVHEFLQYLSSIELVMRIQPGSYPELESRWVQFNISIRDLEKIALEEHLAQVRKLVIEPFEQVIKAYGNPSLAMKKRQKRRLDYEKVEQLKRAGKSIDSKLRENVEQYEALNDTLKKELPKLSTLTEQVGKLCLGNFVNIQVKWYAIWQEKMKRVLDDSSSIPTLKDIVACFQRDFPYAQEQINSIGMLNPAYKGRASLSTTNSTDESMHRSRHRPSDLDTRSRGVSVNGDYVPTLPTPEFARQPSATSSFTMSPGGPMSSAPSPHQYFYRDQYSGLNSYQGSAASPMSQEAPAGSSKSFAGTGATSTRPSTGRSFDSGAIPRQSSDSANQPRRDSNTTYNSNYPPQESSRYSGLFHSAMPMSDTPEDSRRPSRASSRERAPSDRYSILWLAASLFEFNITTTKHEAGYPYLIYQAGEIFDVIAEKGELWLAKNQDDPKEQVGWIWSKHFAKLADS